MQDGKQAVIIGAGPAGLTAAYDLLKKTGIHPIVLEADRCVGGIARTVEYAGNRMDIGGHRFFTKNADIQKLWNEILPTSYDTKKEPPAFLVRHRVSRILYRRHFFSYPVSLGMDTFRGLGLLHSAGIGCSYLSSCFHKRQENTLEDFMVNRFGRKLYETFFEKYTEKVWGRSPKDIGADWGSQRIKGISLWGVVKDFLSRASDKEELSRIGVIQKEDVLDGCVVRMKKAYPAYFDSYKDFPALRRALQGIGGLYCIGRNGQHRYNNMDHSMLTAMEAVRAIRGESTQEALWNVNTERTYTDKR